MAKKTTRTTTTVSSNYPIVKATAFWGIIISGIASLITFIFKCIDKWVKPGPAIGSLIGIMNLVANIALFVSAFLAGWAHSRGKTKALRVLFWVFSIIAILAILGFNVLSMF